MSTTPVEANHTGTENDTVAANSPKSKDGTITVKSESMLRQPKCPVCACPVDDNDLVTCPRCDTPHHRDCWDYTGGCSMFGCDADRWVPAMKDDRAFRALKRLINLWLFFYQASWAAFSIIALMTAAAVPTGILLMASFVVQEILSMAFPLPGVQILPQSLHLIIFPLIGLAVVVTLLVYAMSFPIYALTVIPTMLIRRKIEHELKTRLSIPDISPRSLADRLELPRLGKVFRTLTKMLAFIVRLAMFFSLAALVIQVRTIMDIDDGMWTRKVLGGALIILFFTERCALPAITRAMQLRGIYLATLQNRAAAMLEKGKKD